MSMYRTMVFDCFIKEKFRPFISAVYQKKDWYQFPSPDIWEIIDESDENDRQVFFPLIGSWDEETGRLRFVADYNTHSHREAYEVGVIFTDILPYYCEDDKMCFYSDVDEISYDENHQSSLIDLKHNKLASVNGFYGTLLDNISEYAELSDSWEECSYGHECIDIAPDCFFIYYDALYPLGESSNYYEYDMGILSKSKLKTAAEQKEYFESNGAKFLPASKLVDANGTLVIPAGVDHIGKNTFKNADHIKRVIIPEGVKSIGMSAFENCVNLRSVEFPKSLTEIGERAFCGSGLEEVALPEGIEHIEPYTFFWCESLRRVELPEKLRYIGKRAFAFCTGLEKINLPAGIWELHFGAFYRCRSLKKVELPMGLEVIAYNVFTECSSMTEITIPRSVRYIGDEEADEQLYDRKSLDYGRYAEDTSVFPEVKNAEDLTIIGEENSTAHYYALFHNYNFKSTD